MIVAFVDHSFAIRPAEVGLIGVHRIGEARLSGLISSSVKRAVHLLWLVDPRLRALGPGNTVGPVIAPPEDECSAVFETRFEIAAQRLAAPQMDHRRWTTVSGQVFGDFIALVDTAVAGIQAAYQPALLLAGSVSAIGEPFPVGTDLWDRQERFAVGTEDHRRDVVIEQ